MAEAESDLAALIAAERRQRAEAELLSELAIAVNSTLGLDELLALAVRGLQQLHQASACSVSFLDADGLSFVLAATTDPDLEPLSQRITFPARRSIAGRALRERKVQIVNDLNQAPEYYGRLSRRTPAGSVSHSMLTAPMFAGDEPIGVIQVLSARVGAFQDSDVRLLTTTAGLIAAAVSRARAYERALALAESERRQRELLERLRQVALWIGSSLELDVVLDRILEQLAQVVVFDSTAILMLHEGQLIMAAGRGFRDMGRRKQAIQAANLQDSLLYQEIASTRRPIVLADVRTDDRFRMLSGSEEIRSWIGVPLQARGRVIGLLTVDRYVPAAYDDQDAEVVMAFAEQAAIAIENAQLHRMLQEYASELSARVEERTAEVIRERERLQAVLEHAGGGIAIADPDGIIEYANPAWEALTGYTADRAVRERLRIVSPASFPDLFTDRQNLAFRPRIYRRELTDQRPDGTAYTVEVTVSPVFAGGEGAVPTNGARSPVSLVAVYRDVTEQKALERVKNLFLSSAAHQLRTPLTSILGFSELLLSRDSLPPDQQRRFVEHINQRAQQLTALVEDLLDISKFEAGTGFELKLEHFDLRPVIQEELDWWQANHPDHTYVFGSAADDLRVRADRDRVVRQVLRNLLSNATKFSPAGSVITLDAQPIGRYVEVTVADQGKGMTGQELRNLFTKFWRADDSATAVEGIGLGLVIVKYVVEQHGGRVWVDSAPGEGTVVHFTLLQADHHLTVLVVDDEDTVLEFEKYVLEMGGIEALLARNGQEALTMAATYRPDLILLDLMMPGMSGLEVMAGLMDNPITAAIPVVVVSALSTWQVIDEAHRLRAVDFVTKPFDPEELVARVRRALRYGTAPVADSRPGYGVVVPQTQQR